MCTKLDDAYAFLFECVWNRALRSKCEKIVYAPRAGMTYFTFLLRNVLLPIIVLTKKKISLWEFEVFFSMKYSNMEKLVGKMSFRWNNFSVIYLSVKYPSMKCLFDQMSVSEVYVGKIALGVCPVTLINVQNQLLLNR